ncbi:MAG: hypothetical protein HC804_00280 [Anaerolineae bacterium]|nr:hypothetical protein [Anaerolineae bacterium]
MKSERQQRGVAADIVSGLATINPFVMTALTHSGALETIGAENVIPATSWLLAAEEAAWDAAEKWLQAHAT